MLISFNPARMTFIIIGLSVGLIMGAGIFLLMIYPALRERSQDDRDE